MKFYVSVSGKCKFLLHVHSRSIVYTNYKVWFQYCRYSLFTGSANSSEALCCWHTLHRTNWSEFSDAS